MYQIVYTKKFTKNLKRLRKSGAFNENKLLAVLEKLIHNQKLEIKHKDHQLTGNLKDYRECHVENDLLLMYQKDEQELLLVAINIGSHSILFG